MGAALAWFTTVLALFAGFFMLNHLGVNVGSMIGDLLSGLGQTLGHPLFTG